MTTHRETYRDWQITAERDARNNARPWLAIARRSQGSKQATWYHARGNNVIEAVQAVKRICDESEVANHAG